MMRNATWAMVVVGALVACGGGTKGSKTEPPGDRAGARAGRGPSAPAPAPKAKVAEGKPRSDLIPRQVLFGNPERAHVQISPDGQYLSWIAALDGVLNVWVAPVDRLDEAKAVTADRTRPVLRYFWAFDRKHLLYLQDKAGDENFHVHRVDVTSGEITDLTPLEGARAEIYAMSPRKPNLILVGLNDRDPQVFDLHEIDLATGERRLVVQNDRQFADFKVDHDLRVRFGMTMTPEGGFVVHAYDAKKKAWTEYDRYGADDFMTTGVLAFDKKGTGYYAYDSRGRDTGALFRVDVKTRKKKLIHEDRRVDVGAVMLHPTEHTVQAVQVAYDRPTWVAIDPKVEKDLAAIAKLGPGVPSVPSRTLDDRTWIVVLDNDRGSPTYHRWDRTRQKGTFLFAVQPALDEHPLVSMHPVVIPARDELELVSYLSLPKDADPDDDGKPDRPVPMVLFVHGGPWARDEWGYNPVHQVLANRGYAVLSVNYRGSLGFGKKFVNAGNLQWGKQMHDDLIDAVDWAVASRIAPKDRVCIFGGSYGGYATLVGLTLTPEVFACGVDLVGPSSVVTFIEKIPPYWVPFAAVLHSRVGDPTTPEGKQALLDVSPLTHVDKIEKPLLIGHGANDPRVKRSESDQIVQAMQARKIPVSYVLFPDEGHGMARPENAIAFLALTEAFLSVHLGGWFQPITQAELDASSMEVLVGREWLPGLPDRADRVTAR